MNDEKKEEQRENNRKVLASLGDDDANSSHIFTRMRKRIESMRLVAVFLKRHRQDNQKAQTNIELYLDDWIYQHGPIDYLPSKDHPQGGPAFQNAMEDCVDRVSKQHEALSQRREAAEVRAAEGSLGGEFFDGEQFGDLPSDNDFRRGIESYEKKKARK